MKNILVMMSDNRNISDNYDNCEYNTLTSVINYNYCLSNCYDFKYIQPLINDNTSLYNCYSLNNNLRHSAWSKLLSTIYCINEFKEYDYILYIDSDCVFNNVDILIGDHFINLNVLDDKNFEDFEVLFLNDKPWHPKHPCSGFFILKNNEKTKEIFKQWYSLDVPECDLKHCWEQMALYEMFKTDYNKNLIVADDDMFVNNNPNQFLRHIGSHESHNRIPFFKEKINKLNLNENFSNIVSQIKTKTIKFNTNNLIQLEYGK